MRAIVLEPLFPTGRPLSVVISDILRRVPNAELVTDHVQAVVQGQLALYERTHATAPWIGYFARDEQTGELVGSCSFITSSSGVTVEIAYFTFPGYEGAGVATAMGRGLLAVAARAGNPDLHAFTLPEENASTCVLEKLGFKRAGEGHDEDAGVVWRWERRIESPGWTKTSAFN